MVGSTEEGMLRLLNTNPPLQLQQSGTASWDGRAFPKIAAPLSLETAAVRRKSDLRRRISRCSAVSRDFFFFPSLTDMWVFWGFFFRAHMCLSQFLLQEEVSC